MNAPDTRIRRRSNLDAALLGRTAPLPVAWYFDPGWFEREMLLLFEKGPGYVGHELMVPNVGDYYTLPWTEHGKVLLFPVGSGRWRACRCRSSRSGGCDRRVFVSS